MQHMDGPQNYYARWKEQDTKDHILYESIDQNFQKR